MAQQSLPVTREDLLVRRAKLEKSLAVFTDDHQITSLIDEVDSALERMDAGTYGLCETCHEPIEDEYLAADPLARFCIEHLSTAEKDALTSDLLLASQIQAGLLPQQGLCAAGWETAYLYRPAKIVGGDYCDLLVHDGRLYFAVGDVSGKGVSAGLLMSHLHATFRALVAQDLPLSEILFRASRVFCESSLSERFATLACGIARDDGRVEFAIAGHTPVLVAGASGVQKIKATGLPLGLFCEERFFTTGTSLAPGDTILLYTDGLTEAESPSGEEFGIDRLIDCINPGNISSPQGTIDACVREMEGFRKSRKQSDDLTILALRKV
ncbi:MAG TPA: SpoIIE family protein phosphatase [Acidobacteriota bacterium]|nr:SpoIIE family protein phosphatase [Acidobacteriota bacterium]HQO20051.1 SpoIIE family protein phosphatase [Acidobacteriota bacterium]HQQ47435.1 SpoIIE family protein phosphatase [Acidobacteriota bacterium]